MACQVLDEQVDFLYLLRNEVAHWVFKLAVAIPWYVRGCISETGIIHAGENAGEWRSAANELAAVIYKVQIRLHTGIFRQCLLVRPYVAVVEEHAPEGCGDVIVSSECVHDHWL